MDAPGFRLEAQTRTLGGAEPQEVVIMLGGVTAETFRPKHLDDLLEREDSFLAAGRRDDRPRLLSKDTLLWLRTPSATRELSVDDLFATDRRIEVALADGSRIAGHVLYDVGDPAAPLEEFMNLQGHWFEVVEAGWVYFVHKRFVAWIEELP